MAHAIAQAMQEQKQQRQNMGLMRHEWSYLLIFSARQTCNNDDDDDLTTIHPPLTQTES